MKSFSHVRLLATPWTIAHQAPPSMEFSRQEYWSGLPFPSPGDLPDPGIDPGLLHCGQRLYRLSHQGSLHLIPFSKCISVKRGRKTKHNFCFPGGSDGKASACNAGNPGSIHGSGRSPGEGNGNQLQYSCLENSMDGGAWWVTAHGVTKSWTQLSNFTFTFHFHALEKEMATHSSTPA